MIFLNRASMAGAVWILWIVAVLIWPAGAAAQRNAPQNIVVDATPSHAVSSGIGDQLDRKLA